MLQRCSTASPFPTSVDETGRLVLPAKLRNKIDLDGEAFLSLPVTRSRSGSPKPTRPKNGKTEEWLDDLPEDFDPTGSSWTA